MGNVVPIRPIKAIRKCSACCERKPASEFYQYEYTTRQGKRSLRSEGRCKPCRDANRPRKTDRKWSRYRREAPQASVAENKVCSACLTEKPRSEFNASAAARDGLRHTCRDCHLEGVTAWQKANPQKDRLMRRNSQRRRLLRDLSLTEADYQAMHDACCGVCEICGGFSPLCLDHCHVTGRVRGLLCRSCNLAVGNVGEDVGRALSLIRYLREKCEVQDSHRRPAGHSAPEGVALGRNTDFASGMAMGRSRRGHPALRQEGDLFNFGK